MARASLLLLCLLLLAPTGLAAHDEGGPVSTPVGRDPPLVTCGPG